MLRAETLRDVFQADFCRESSSWRQPTRRCRPNGLLPGNGFRPEAQSVVADLLVSAIPFDIGINGICRSVKRVGNVGAVGNVRHCLLEFLGGDNITGGHCPQSGLCLRQFEENLERPAGTGISRTCRQNPPSGESGRAHPRILPDTCPAA